MMVVCGCGPATKEVTTTPATQPVVVAAAPRVRAEGKEYLLHLPGIGGEMRIDGRFVQGVRDGGFTGAITIYDWTRGQPGMPALLAYDANHEEAKTVAKKIADRLKIEPDARVTVTAHSGGAGIAVWAMEALPADCEIENLVLIAPALSPFYDLSAAMKHVRGKVYVYSSLADSVVLGTGTRMFGTIDGLKTDAAGRVGFTQPRSADAGEYAKLDQMPYDPAWEKHGNYGDHIGAMAPRFARDVIVPLVFAETAKPQAESRAAGPATLPVEAR